MSTANSNVMRFKQFAQKVAPLVGPLPRGKGLAKTRGAFDIRKDLKPGMRVEYTSTSAGNRPVGGTFIHYGFPDEDRFRDSTQAHRSPIWAQWDGSPGPGWMPADEVRLERASSSELF